MTILYAEQAETQLTPGDTQTYSLYHVFWSVAITCSNSVTGGQPTDTLLFCVAYTVYMYSVSFNKY